MNGYEAYQESEVYLADPVHLVTLLYRGALDSVRCARLQLRSGDIEGRGRSISTAAAILLELVSTLDHERGGEISRNLAGLYVYMQQRLTEGHVAQLDQPLVEVEDLLDELTSAWESISNIEARTPVAVLPTGEVGVPALSCSF